MNALKFTHRILKLAIKIVDYFLFQPILDVFTIIGQLFRGYSFEEWARYRKLRSNTDLALKLRVAVTRKKIYFMHPHSIVIGTKNIGKYCSFAQNVTVGYKDGFPTLGDHITIYPNSMILGPVKIGSNAIIGFQSVVTTDVPEGQVWAGNPAKYIRHVDPDKDLEPNKYLMVDTSGKVQKMPFIFYTR